MCVTCSWVKSTEHLRWVWCINQQSMNVRKIWYMSLWNMHAVTCRNPNKEVDLPAAELYKVWQIKYQAGNAWRDWRKLHEITVYGDFLKCWYRTTMGFPTRNDHFEVFWGYHHLRKHPYKLSLGPSQRNWTYYQNHSSSSPLPRGPTGSDRRFMKEHQINLSCSYSIQ